MSSARPTAFLALMALLGMVSCGPNSPAAQMLPTLPGESPGDEVPGAPGEPSEPNSPSGDEPTPPGEPMLMANAINTIYGQANPGKGWLGCTVQGDRVWLSHGGTNTLLGTALVAATDAGDVVAVNRAGAIAPLQSLTPDTQWRAAAEGLILAATPRQLWVLNYDNNSGGVRGEMFRWMEGEGTPVEVRGAAANHNRSMIAVPNASGNASLVAAHSPTYGWPSMQVVRQPNEAAPVAGGASGTDSPGTPAVPVVYRSRVYVFTPTIPRSGVVDVHPALGRLAADGSAVEVLAVTEADLWPAGSGDLQSWAGFPHMYWPQVTHGIETPNGLFVVTNGSTLWFIADDGAGGLVLPARKIETVAGRSYAAYRSGLIAVDADGSLYRRSGESWAGLATLPHSPGAARHLCLTATGAVVATGNGGTIDGQSGGFWLAIWRPLGALTRL